MKMNLGSRTYYLAHVDYKDSPSKTYPIPYMFDGEICHSLLKFIHHNLDLGRGKIGAITDVVRAVSEFYMFYHKDVSNRSLYDKDPGTLAVSFLPLG